MNKEKLFGLKPNFITVAYSQLIKSAIFLRYGIKSDEKIFLSSKPSPILGGLEIFQRGDGCQVDKGILVGTIFLALSPTKLLPLKKLMGFIVR